MNRKLRRASKLNGRKQMKKGWNDFRDITEEAVSINRTMGNTGYRPDQMFSNNMFTVQVFFKKEILGLPATKIMIRRNDARPVVAWHDLQRIKNELYGEDSVAVQVFPKDSELVDQANIYWLWVLEEEEVNCEK